VPRFGRQAQHVLAAELRERHSAATRTREEHSARASAPTRHRCGLPPSLLRLLEGGGSMSQFWKPGAPAPWEVDRENARELEATAVLHNPNGRLALDVQRRALPIAELRTQLLYLCERYRTVVVVGSTGCGKTTQLPQYLHEAGWAADGRCVVCTQPRRVAAITVATRVASEMGVALGSTVGYCVRFGRCYDEEQTRIKYVTDGLLLREMMVDPLLSKYSCIMLDEAHERSLHTDILCGLLRKVQRKRPELRLIVASATLNAKEFKDFFETNTRRSSRRDTATCISVGGRGFPVDIQYLQKPTSNYVEAAVDTVLKIHAGEPSGDILCFLTGADEIEQACSLISDRAAHGGRYSSGVDRLIALPMYSGLPHDHQIRVFEKARRHERKVVVATNIAETSITIEGIVHVVDCGFVKMRAYNPRYNLDALTVLPLSRASATQRAGRAGRTRPGKCYRLYTQHAFEQVMPAAPPPEMARTDLAPVVLQLKALGIDDILQFDFLTPPPAENMLRALELLYALGALDQHAALTTPIGQRLVELPCSPSMGRMLLASAEPEHGCAEDALSIAAMLQVEGVFKGRPELAAKQWAVAEGDLMTWLNIYRAYEAVAPQKRASWAGRKQLNPRVMQRASTIREQLKKFLTRFGLKLETAESEPTAISRCIVCGFFANAAVRQPDNTYATLRGQQELHLHPNSCVFKTPPQHIVFHEVLVTTKQYMRDVSAIDSAWLPELAPHYYSYKNPALNPGGRANTAAAAAAAGDPASQMFEEGTHKRRKLGPSIERLT
jgi:ATP-dependent RNA helicase DDX35